MERRRWERKKERKQATPSTGYLDHHGIIDVTAFADYQDADTGRSGWFFCSFFAGLGSPVRCECLLISFLQIKNLFGLIVEECILKTQGEP